MTEQIPWVEKYRPQTLKELAGSQNIIEKLTKFIQNFQLARKEIVQLKKTLKNTTDPKLKKKASLKLKSYSEKLKKKKASLLIGPPGIGKTTIVYALANEFNLSVIELNASDARTEEALTQKLGETVKSQNLLSFTKKKVKGKLILIDEVDGLHGRSDKGGIPTLVKIIESSKYPVIMTCNFRDDRKFGTLYNLANPLIDIPQALPKFVGNVLSRIAKSEGLSVSEEEIKLIAMRSNGDYRSAINDLQALSQGTKKVGEGDMQAINMARDSEENVGRFLIDLFQSNSIREAKRVLDNINHSDIDFRSISLWINENLLQYLTKSGDIYHGFDNLAYADRILGYILRTQDYSHLSYFYDILAGGIKYSKSDQILSKGGIRSPRWFRFRAIPNDEIALALQEEYRQPLNDIMREIRPKLSIFLKYDPKLADFFGSILNIPPKKVKTVLK